MNFTTRTNARRVISGFLTIAVVGLIGWVHRVEPVPTPMNTGQNTFAVAKSLPTSGSRWVDTSAAPALALPDGVYYQPISHWYKSKHWWKRNAPIVGGAGGGALVGGLVGGGTGALVGGAIGGGGGYLYKRSRRHHYHYHHQ